MDTWSSGPDSLATTPGRSAGAEPWIPGEGRARDALCRSADRERDDAGGASGSGPIGGSRMTSDSADVTRPGGDATGGGSQPLEARTYLTVSAVGLAVSVGLLLFLVFGADRIVAAGLDHRVFYVLLVPLGMSAAAFAFGAMKSTATFQGKSPRDVTLTGPAVFAAMVVLGGFFLVPEGGLRSVAVRVDRSAEEGGGPVPGAEVRLDW